MVADLLSTDVRGRGSSVIFASSTMAIRRMVWLVQALNTPFARRQLWSVLSLGLQIDVSHEVLKARTPNGTRRVTT